MNVICMYPPFWVIPTLVAWSLAASVVAALP